MAEFIVSVYEEGNVVGAEVKVSSGNTVDKIEIVDADDLNELLTTIQNLTDNYVSKTYLESTLENEDFSTTINATEFDGHTSNYFATSTHEHDYAPVSHADTTGEYGIGTDTSYGHVKTINDITDNSYVSGRALSSYQGKVLDDKITAVKNEVEGRGKYIKYNTVLQKGSNVEFYAYNADGTPIPNKELTFIIGADSHPYPIITGADGKGTMQINLNAGLYPFVIFTKTGDPKDLYASGTLHVYE